MAKKEKPKYDTTTYGYCKNEEGTIDLIFIHLNSETNECEIERETQGYKEAYRAMYDLNRRMSEDFIKKGNK